MEGHRAGAARGEPRGPATKVEGNPRHPESLGGTTAFAQAAILDLYDPDRSTGPSQRGQARGWDEAAAFLHSRGAALGARGGAGLAVLTEAHRSPTLQRLLGDLARAQPAARIFRYEPFPRDAVREGARLAFGRAVEPLFDLANARVIVALDSDFLFMEGGPVRQARDFAQRRQIDQPGNSINRLYAVESAFTATGAAADHRLRLRRTEVPRFAFALARALAASGVDLGGELSAALAFAAPEAQNALSAKWAEAVAKDLAAHRGSGVLIAGEAQPKAVHALFALLNERLGNAGKAVRYVEPFDMSPEGAAPIGALARAMDRGEVDTLLILGGNPAFTAPADLGFASALEKVAHVIHVGTHLDETAQKAEWHLNRAHLFESWDDVRAADGTASIVQPLIAPLFGGKTDAEVVSLLLAAPRSAYELVRQTWRSPEEADGEHAWRRALRDGLLADSAHPSEGGLAASPAAVAAEVREEAARPWTRAASR